ncbi:hypothetical protein LTR84_001508 [Exophiala bonariae]|uniref:Uncharacterized protein n=1 Tax=Exophiala bonariae TaxID=1690606 RepID=A0AAV9NCJ7_9EURO|nr:hypothetical protein LTR84_001508 [Exophiala bonariae]
MALSLVYASQDAASLPAVDIVAVHGLNGDAVNTWTHPKSKAFWLRDFLPNKVPDARILTFGYNAAAAFGHSTAEIIDHAKSLLISLIDKREESEALLQARLDPRYQQIKDSTLGIIFMGTPHGGSDKATYGKVLANIAQFIVDQHSALLQTNYEEQVPIDANHSMICKFETEEDDTFEKVYKRVQRMRDSPRRVLNNQLVAHNKHFEVPHLLSPVFTGRDDVLKRLTTSFTAKRRSLKQHQQRFVLFGLGGSGKTQTCLKFVHQHRQSDNLVQQCFVQIARLLQTDENINSVKRTLANTSLSWLLIFDNADNPNLRLTPYFPPGDRGDIIIASRNPQHQHYNTVGYEEVDQLSPSDSLVLLSKVAYGETSPLLDTLEKRKTIVEILGYHALAIVQAGAYIRETSCSLSHYLEVYEQRRKDLLDNLPPHLGTDYQHSVYATWQVSVDMIESTQISRISMSNSSLQILGLLGFYHHDQVPIQMFYCSWQNLQARGIRPDHFPWHNAPSDFFDYRHSVQESITLLAMFSLVTRNADLSLSVHPLVHDWCRERLSIEQQHSTCRRALYLLANSVNWEYRTEDYTLRRSLTPHVHELLRLQALYGDIGQDKTQYWPTLALILRENGCSKDAIILSEEVLELDMTRLGDEHPETLKSMTNLANQYSDVGRYSEALQISEKVLKGYQSKPGEISSSALRSMHDLAIRYSEVGRWTEALDLTNKVLKLQKTYLGEGHPDTLRTMSNLTARYTEAGRHREALQLTEEIYELQKVKLGEHHPDSLRSMHNLAIQYSDAGRQPEALHLTEKVLELMKSKLGEHHPDTLAAMQNLAIRRSEAGQKSKALQITEEVLELRKAKLGADHPDTLISMHNLAVWYGAAGRQGEKLQLTEEVLKLKQSKLGDDHPDTLMSMSNLAICHDEDGRQSEAVRLTEEVLALRKTKLGDSHPHTQASEQYLEYLLQTKSETSSTPKQSQQRRRFRLTFFRGRRPGKMGDVGQGDGHENAV